ncbi:MAG: hypothetical protein H5T86_09390, partial [Armatimonadetes bacterium]|nr:hypothetical protein [Armatimonadota bacterium]
MSASFMTAAVAALTAVASPVRAVQAEAGETVAAIRTPSVACVFDKRTGTLNSIVGTASGSKLVSAGDNEPLFQLVFAETGSEKKVYLSSLHARDRSVVASSSSGIARLTLEFSRLDGRDVSATCTVWAAEKERAVHLRISVKFGKGLQLETVQFPFLRLAVPLGADANDDAVVMGRTKGGLLRAPLRWPEGTAVAARQPGSLAAQFACYYDPRGGLYTACHDTAGHPKGIVLARDAAGLRMCWEQYTFSEDGQYELGYDVVVDSFGASGSASADWRDAADIYKSWAIKQAWCAKTYSRRPDVPKWMKAGPAMVRFGRDWLSEPQAILEWIDAYWRKYFPSQVPLIVAFWGWEKHGAWITPDYFPAFPSDEEFTALVAELRKRNCHVFLWPSGYHFTLTRGAKPDGSFEYDARELFQRHFAPHAVWTRRGEPYHGPRSWLQGGETACMCP